MNYEMNSIECKRRDSNSYDSTWKVDTLANYVTFALF
jgi:hypothetical protein